MDALKKGRTTVAGKKWVTLLFGILAVAGLSFFGFELWQWTYNQVSSDWSPIRPEPPI
jgi:hypothetical protein